MGKQQNDERTISNEFKQLLLPDQKRNFILCSSTSSSIKDTSSNSSISISASPASTTSHLSEYSSSQTDHNPKPNESQDKTIADNLSTTIDLPLNSSNIEQTSETSKNVDIKDEKLNKENYALLLNDLERFKNYRKPFNSIPSTKSSSINSLNQLIKLSPSNCSTNQQKQINRSLTCIDQTQDRTPKQINQQYSSKQSNNDRYRLSKSASSQSQNFTNFESNLPQSYSAVFNDKQLDNNRYSNRFDNHLSNQFYNNYQNSHSNTYQNNQLPNQSIENKISFKGNFYRKWFLNKFKIDNEFNFDQERRRESKNPKLTNLKRCNSIDLFRDNNEKKRTNESSGKQLNARESTFSDNNSNYPNDQNEILIAGPSGLQMMKKKNSDSNLKNNHFLRSDLKIQPINNPLHSYYLNAANCDMDSGWNDSSDLFNAISDHCSEEDNRRLPYEPRPSITNDKLKRTNNAQSSNEQIKNKKSILLPKLHNEYCTNTNSSHHKHHLNENSSTTTTRSSSTNSSNISSSSSDTDKVTNKTTLNNLKPNTKNDLSGSLSSVSSDVNTDPMLPICKICHLNAKDEDPLITPCKCSGTMQFIHCKCLMRWLEISKKKSRKPLACELCMYQYQWHKKFVSKVGHWQWPKCEKKDKFLHCIFLISVIIMICCALSIIIFFKMQEPIYKTERGRYDLSVNEPATVGFALIFVLSFCMSLYAQVKARTTLYRLIMNFIYLNQQWYIDEYEKNVKEMPGTPEIV